MAASSGNGGVLQTSPDDSTYSAIASLQSWTLEQAADAIETSEMGTSLTKSFIPGQTSFSGSAEALWNDDDTSQESIQTALTGGDSTFYVKLYPIGTSAGDYYSGQILITGVSITASLNSPIGFSFSFQGTGTLTLNNA
jgi:predicted secreted protein